jgi:hypothetical protein
MQGPGRVAFMRSVYSGPANSWFEGSGAAHTCVAAVDAASMVVAVAVTPSPPALWRFPHVSSAVTRTVHSLATTAADALLDVESSCASDAAGDTRPCVTVIRVSTSGATSPWSLT